MEFTCLRCRHIWTALKEGSPAVCPACHAATWNRETVRETRKEKELKERIKILENLLVKERAKNKGGDYGQCLSQE